MGYSWTREVSRDIISENLNGMLIYFVFLYCRYHSLAPMYYRGAQAAIVVYDIKNQDSFQRAKTWVKELHKQVSILCISEVIIRNNTTTIDRA